MLRAFFIGVASGSFTAIGILQLGIYTELRVAKVRALERMASVRCHFVAQAESVRVDIGDAVGAPAAVNACPKFLERPSDDWYTLVLMALMNAVAVAVCAGSVLYGVRPGWFRLHRIELVGTSLFFLVFPAYTQFRWFTLRCFTLDCLRAVNHGPSTSSRIPGQWIVPFTVRWLDLLAAKIEKTHMHDIMKGVRAQHGPPNTGPDRTQRSD